MTEGKEWLATLTSSLAPWGLNHVGVASVAAWDAQARPETRSERLAPGARSVVVIASGGAELWQAFVQACRDDPATLLDAAHPLDAFTRRAIVQADPDPDHPWFYAAHDAAVPLDFRTLAVLAGLGAPSRLGLVLDRRWGPWLGLRAAAFVAHDLAPTPPAPDLCAGCDGPCETACPGDAFVDHRWSVDRCAGFHQRSQACVRSCVAREACPVGAAHAYPDAERLYHNNRAEGRAALREALGLDPAQDPHAGTGPYWSAWSGPVAE